MCEVYGYVIAHPEEVIYNAAYCYHAYYGLKTGPLVVLVGSFFQFLAFQYLNQWTKYTWVVDMAKKTPAYIDRLQALELERTEEYYKQKEESHADGARLMEVARTMEALGIGQVHHN